MTRGDRLERIGILLTFALGLSAIVVLVVRSALDSDSSSATTIQIENRTEDSDPRSDETPTTLAPDSGPIGATVMTLQSALEVASEECSDVESLMAEFGLPQVDPFRIATIWFQNSDYRATFGGDSSQGATQLVEVCARAVSERVQAVLSTVTTTCDRDVRDLANSFGLPPTAGEQVLAGSVANGYPAVWKQTVFTTCLRIIQSR